jgi:hypothetical protein
MTYPDLSDLRTRVLTITNEASTSSIFTSAVLNRFINDAERDIAAKTGCLEHIDSLTTTASTRSVPFSGYKVKNLEYIPVSGTRIGLPKITLKHFGRLPLSGATPQYWTQWGGFVLIEPIPASAYTLYATISDYPLVEMSSDTDEPSIPSTYHEDLIWYAVSRCYMRKGRREQAAYAYNRYIEAIQFKKFQRTYPKQDARLLTSIPEGVNNE